MTRTSGSSSSPTSSRRSSNRRMRPEANRKVSPTDRKATATPQNQTAVRVFPPTVIRGQPSGVELTPDLTTGGRWGVLSHQITCADSPCFPGVPCEPTATGSFRCGHCPYGYTGDGVTCRGSEFIMNYTMFAQTNHFQTSEVALPLLGSVATLSLAQAALQMLHSLERTRTSSRRSGKH